MNPTHSNKSSHGVCLLSNFKAEKNLLSLLLREADRTDQAARVVMEQAFLLPRMSSVSKRRRKSNLGPSQLKLKRLSGPKVPKSASREI